MRIFDALTYHAALAQAAPTHYVCILHLDNDEPVPVLKLPEGSEHVVLHVGCCTPQDHEWNSKHVMRIYAGMLGVYITEKNMFKGVVPCHRCKLY